MEPPRIMALITSAAILSNKSAPRAAQSPTLSPTCQNVPQKIETLRRTAGLRQLYSPSEQSGCSR